MRDARHGTNPLTPCLKGVILGMQEIHNRGGVSIMKKTKGFTLIELMIVVAIIGILSAIAVPKFADLIRKSNEGSTKGNLGALRSALSIYYGEMEGWFPVPTASGAQTVAGSLGAILTMDNGKYLKALPPCYTPPHHGKVSSATLLAEKGDTGDWGYQPNRAAVSPDEAWGDLWVNCSHTDSRNNVWSAY